MQHFSVEKIAISRLAGDGKDKLILLDGHLRINSRVLICSGIATTEALAFAKMVSEIAERLAYVELSTKPGKIVLNGSTGFAAHSDQGAAEILASFELIERSFLDKLGHDPALKPDIVSENAWYYYIGIHSAWCVLVREQQKGAFGWGASVRNSRREAYTAALSEAKMIAASLFDYGRRGNAITALTHGAERIGGSIQITQLPKKQILGQSRYVCHAAWSAK